MKELHFRSATAYLSMLPHRVFFCMLITISLLTLTSCQVTLGSAWEQFKALPFKRYELIASATRETSTDDCHDVMVEAVYHASPSFSEMIQEMEKELLASGWSKVGEDLTENTPVQYASYELSDQAYVTIRSKVDPIPCSKYKREECIDLQPLSLDSTIDNENPDDGYILIRFYYHPYSPNNCGG